MKNFKRFFLAVFFFVELSFFFGQASKDLRNIRVAFWAELDAYPEIYEKSDDKLKYPKERIQEISRFLFEGMIYGWKFVYTPSDVVRGVEEYLEVVPIQEFGSADVINYSDAFFENNRVTVWCTYTRKDFQIQNYELWASIKNPVVKGKGMCEVRKGFEGIEIAARNAVKDAVRQHYRGEIKNKPKEISGSLLIRQPPLVGINEGQYVIFLDFFLEHDRIINYTAF